MITLTLAGTLEDMVRDNSGVPLNHVLIKYGRFTIEYRAETLGQGGPWEIMEGAGHCALFPTLAKCFMALSAMAPEFEAQPQLKDIQVFDKRMRDPQPVGPNASIKATLQRRKMFLVWSVKHRMWWKPLERGYTPRVSEAGLYTESECDEIEERSQCAQRYNQISVRIPFTALAE
jgi:hypothetical protein